MKALPRLAVGTVQPQVQREPAVWALLSAARAVKLEATLLHSASYLMPHDAARSLTGTGSRHLDSWAMSRSACLRTMHRAAAQAELAIVDGVFDVAVPAVAAPEVPTGSSLDLLCDWLDLPRIALVDLSLLDACRLPPRPERVDGVLLDRARGSEHALRWQTTLEAVWRAPVVGWLDEAQPLRDLCAALPPGRDPSPELCQALGARLLPNLRLDRLLSLAARWPLPELPLDDVQWEFDEQPLRIALAYDEDFCGYFPDALDLLEAAGAQLCDFSPLRSGALPPETNIVFFGCGHPERQPEVLAGNHCLQQSLRSFAASGGRIYAQGSGLAYLCREIALPDGRRFPMTGLLPAVARHWTDAGPPEPIELTYGADSWLVDAGTTIRGYRHPGWQIEPQGAMVTYADDPRHKFDVLGRGNTIGSRVLVNLAANEHLLRRFVEPVPVMAGVRRRRAAAALRPVTTGR